LVGAQPQFFAEIARNEPALHDPSTNMAVASKRTQCAQIYGWFTEGFDAADLKDAKVLRDQSDWKHS
jgi:hypothetical protein